LLAEEKKPTSHKSALSAVFLGYRGFTVEALDKDSPSKLFCFDGIPDIVDQRYFSVIANGNKFEYAHEIVGEEKIYPLLIVIHQV